MQRTERHIILNSKKIDDICFLSKNLYNLANYYIRQEFINNKKWLRYLDIYKIVKDTVDYKVLPAQTAQQILKLLDKNWVSFFKNIKFYKKNGSLGKPRLPKYKHKTKGRNITVFTNQQISIKKGFINFPKRSNLEPLKTKVKGIQQIRIIPQATCYVIEVIYKKEVKSVEKVFGTYLSIDIGLNNLATCTNNIGKSPFIVNGKPLKSINQYFNKKRALLMSYVGNLGWSNRIKRLTHKRNNKINDYIHKTSRFIVNYCIEHRIENIVIGKNNDWKQNINLGKRNNQNFVNVPFDKLIQQIQYKSEDVGINVINQEESYTSKCSFLDLEPVKKQVKYLGKRVKRGLFKSFKGILINADVNGSLNILRKVVDDSLIREIINRGLVLKPIKINF